MILSLSMRQLVNWVRSLFLTRITSVEVKLWENGKEILNFDTYPQNKLLPLISSIDGLWGVPENSAYWFETEVRENRNCWKRSRPTTTMHVVCYRTPYNSTTMDEKEELQIPGKYMKKMLGRRHLIFPAQIGYTPWPERIEVKFLLVE